MILELGYFGGACFVALVTIAIFHFIHKWRNPTSINGRLPPGSMGFPIIGETIQFFIPTKSLDVPAFLSKRIKKYGPLFRTSLLGRPVVVSADPDFNHYILQQEGRLVEFWYTDSFNKLVGQAGITAFGLFHKYIRNRVLNQFGPEALKQKLLPELEELWVRVLQDWKARDYVEVKQSVSTMLFDFVAKALFGYEPDKSSEDMSKNLNNFVEGLMTSIPLNIPGTSFHRCLQGQKKVIKLVKDAIQERRVHPEKHRGDFLDQMLDDMKQDKFITDNTISFVIFGLLLATVESMSFTITVTIKLLIEHPHVVEELMKEHEEILKSRENQEARITWAEYKSMTFTMQDFLAHHVRGRLRAIAHYQANLQVLKDSSKPATYQGEDQVGPCEQLDTLSPLKGDFCVPGQVIQESLRLSNMAPGVLRRTIKDVEVNGYTIPKGWTILIAPVAIHLNPETYKDPLSFNPWHWKDLEASMTQKNFTPFGGGPRQCAGAEFSKLLLSLCIHQLVTKYRWTRVKGGEISRSTALTFRNGYYIKVADKFK